MNVYKVNDCDWVAANSFEEGKSWYLDEFGVDEDECWLVSQYPLDCTLWVDMDDLPIDELKQAQEIRNGMVKKTFKWVMDNLYVNATEPYIIASTEY